MPDNPSNDNPSNDNPSNEEALQEILRRVEEKLRRKLRLGDLTLDEIEEQSQDIGEEVKRIVEEKSLHLVGTGHTAPTLACPFLSSSSRSCLAPLVLVADDILVAKDTAPVTWDCALVNSLPAAEHGG